MQQYLKMLDYILKNGHQKDDRTNTGTISVFGYQNRYNLQEGFPLLTTKKLHWQSIVYELLWFIKGDTNIKYLQDHDVRIWNQWADNNGNLGPIYGYQWRHWVNNRGQVIDQLQNVIDQIKTNPNSRRLIINAWNVGDIDLMALPPCHAFVQFYVVNHKLSCQLYQRSADAFLGVPFNIASYALLTHMIAQVCDLEVGEFIHTFGDLHIYNNHLTQVQTQLQRTPKKLPTLKLNPTIKNIEDFTFDDIYLLDYDPYPSIKGDVSV